MADDTRLWMYRAGEACLFEHPDHVPAGQGWQRFPAPCGGSEPFLRTPRVSLPAPGPDQEPTDQEKLDRMSRQRLMQVAADCGVPTAALANAARAEKSTQRVARLFEVPLAVVNDAVAFERSLMAA